MRIKGYLMKKNKRLKNSNKKSQNISKKLKKIKKIFRIKFQKNRKK